MGFARRAGAVSRSRSAISRQSRLNVGLDRDRGGPQAGHPPLTDQEPHRQHDRSDQPDREGKPRDRHQARRVRRSRPLILEDLRFDRRDSLHRPLGIRTHLRDRGSRLQPRLGSLRGSSLVHRLVAAIRHPDSSPRTPGRSVAGGRRRNPSKPARVSSAEASGQTKTAASVVR